MVINSAKQMMKVMQPLTREQLLSVAHQFGTPTYVYDAATITNQYQQLTTAFPDPNIFFFYAAKALTNVTILKHINAIGVKVDCSSVNEIKLALYAGIQPSNILYTSNGVAFEEIEEAKNLSVHINIDSLSNLEKFGKRFGDAYPVGLRLRPNILAGGNLKIATGHDKSKFGIPIDQLHELLAVQKKYNLFIRGLHIHTGSEIKDVVVFEQGMTLLFDLLPQFPDIQFIDLGGGFKVAYSDNDAITDIKTLGKNVCKYLEHYNNKREKKLQIWFEPGKFLVSEAGRFITQVNVLKQTTATTFACVNSGFNHLVRPMFYNAYHRIHNISNPNGAIRKYTVVGNICETDTFAWERPINEIREGDYLVFDNAGAYGFEMSSEFNSRCRPAEVLVKNNIATLIRKRSTFEDLLRNQII